MTAAARIANLAGMKLRSKPLDPGDRVPDPLRRLVRTATHPDPNRRLLDMDSFAVALRGERIEDLVEAPATCG